MAHCFRRDPRRATKTRQRASTSLPMILLSLLLHSIRVHGWTHTVSLVPVRVSGPSSNRRLRLSDCDRYKHHSHTQRFAYSPQESQQEPTPTNTTLIERSISDGSSTDHFQENADSTTRTDVPLLSNKETATTTSSFRTWLQTNVLLGFDPTPELLAIVFIYFVQGALGLARLAQTYLLKDELSLGPAELSALTGIFTLPWTIKPLYGFVSDGFPLFQYQRKSYLVLAGILGGLSYTLLGMDTLWESLDKGLAVQGTVAALLLSSASIALSDVVADGIVVKQTREASASDPSLAGGLQSLCWGASAFGGLLSAYFSGSLLEVMSVRNVFGLAAILPFLVSVIALGIDEKPASKDMSQDNNLVDGVKDQITTLWETFQQPSIWRPALFLFLWQSTPTSDGAFFFFLTNDLHLGPEFLGRVRLLDAVAGIFGVWLYQKYLRTAKIKDILYWSTIASFPLGLLPILLVTHANRSLGIPDTALIFGDDVILTALGQISFLPTLVLAAKLCPPGVEAVLFATLMSIFNGASTVGTEIGAALTKVAGVTESNFDNL